MGFKSHLTIMNSQKSIIINGFVYSKKNLDTFFHNNDSGESWVKHVHHFLTDWFDDSDAIITQTSGSTGVPKEIRLAKHVMRNSAKMTNSFFELGETKTALLCLPASYIAGKMMLVRAIVGNFNLICTEPKANPFEDINVDIDFTAITPYQLSHSVKTLKNTNIKNIIVGGGHVNTKLESLTQEIPSALYETYGMTETASHIALRKFNGDDKSNVFSILNGVKIRQDERNCLVLSAPHLIAGELITNDMIEIIDEKSFRWLGRADSVINSGGVKIFPEQVEKKLEQLINERFFVSSISDEILGEAVILIIECNKESAIFYKQEIYRQSMLLDKYEIPKEIFYNENFSYSISSKILRKETQNLASKI